MNQLVIPSNIDFSQLVQTGTTLTVNFQSKLIKKLEETFTESEQRWYIANLYMYVNYHPTNDFPIDLENVYKLMGFAHKKNAKRTLENNFTLNEEYKILLLPTEKQVKTNGGAGLNKEQILLNVDTFKNLCMLTKSEESKKIRRYYIRLETIYNELIMEEKKEFEKQLEDQQKQIEKHQNHVLELESVNENLKREKELERHMILLNEFATAGSMVYIIRVKSYDNGEYIIKIGESRRGVASRYAEHRQKYEETIILDCFKVIKSKDFEHFLHTHKDIRPNQILNLPGHENERELFLIGKQLSYTQLTNIIHQNIKTYNDHIHLEHQLTQSKLEIEKLQMLNQMHLTSDATDNIISILAQNNKILLDEIKNLKNELKKVVNHKIDELKMELRPKKTTTHFGEELPTLGPYVQQLNPDTLHLVKIFNSVAEVCSMLNISRSSITKACRENTVYNGYRWNLVDRQLDPNKVEHIQPTRPLEKIQNLGYIAKLNNDKTEITHVYLDRKTASIKNNYASVSYLDYFVKNNKIVDGYYYVLYDTLHDDIKNKFLQKHDIEKVVLYKSHGVGQFNTNGQLLREFRSKQECQQQLNIGNKSLCKALETSNVCNGYIYKYLSDKVFI